MAAPASRGRAARTLSYEARPSRDHSLSCTIIGPSGGGRLSSRGTLSSISAHGRSVVTNRPAYPFEESEITVPHKSRSPDAISKPSHPQYFRIKEHTQHKESGLGLGWLRQAS